MKTKTFERISRGWGWSPLLALVAALGCGAQGVSDESLASSGAAAIVSTAPDFSPTFFTARVDMRKCASPMCGGYFVASVNDSMQRCPNGSFSRECYVASIDLSALKLSSDQEAQVRKAIGYSADAVGVLLQGKLSIPAITTSISPVYGKLIATHAWLAPAPAPIKGSFFGLADTKVVCFTAPCPSIRGLLLNQTQTSYFGQVDLTAAPGTDEEKSAAYGDLSNGNGLIAVGPLVPILTDAKVGPVLSATQFFRVVQPYNPCMTVKCSSGYHCEPKTLECLVAPCPQVGVCVADPVQPDPVRCGGIAGVKCPGAGQCIDDPSDDCDPAKGGADCGGICQCNLIPRACPTGYTWNSSPTVCDCEKTVSIEIPCGKNTCTDGQYCCNASCGICASKGSACIQIVCEPPQ